MRFTRNASRMTRLLLADFVDSLSGVVGEGRRGFEAELPIVRTSRRRPERDRASHFSPDPEADPLGVDGTIVAELVCARRENRQGRPAKIERPADFNSMSRSGSNSAGQSP